MRRLYGLVFVVILLSPLIVVADSSLTEQALEVLKDCRLALQRTCPDHLNVKFHLFTRQNQTASQLVHVTRRRDNLHKTFFDPSLPNKVIIHGLNPRLYKTDLVAVKDAYLSREEANVWMVDWSKLAAGGACVVFSLHNTDHVARCAAQMVAAIARYAPRPRIHVVADRAGVRVAHKLAQAISPRRLMRITGLNPEGGSVPAESDANRLSHWDADFVDTIHTSPLLPTTEMFGKIDFYVNPNRIHQPGCENSDKGKFVCDKARALRYFAESITSQVGFVAWQCSNSAQLALGTCSPHPPSQTMGDTCRKGASGTYIVFTAKESPHALGHWEGKLYNEKGPKTRTDVISRYSTGIKSKLALIEENTPEIVKEMGIVDSLKSRLDDKTDDLKAAALKIGWRGLKALATHIMENKVKVSDSTEEK